MLFCSGSPTNIRGGSSLHCGVLHKALGNCSNVGASAYAFSINYSDCGLFGVTVAAPRDDISDVVSSVATQLQSISRDGVGNDLVNAAKRKLQARILMEAECGSSVADIAYQASVLDGVVSPQQIASMVDKITSDNVSAVARRVLAGKKSIATVGQKYTGPFLQDL